MPLPPVRYATLAIVVFLAIAGFDIVTGLEHWPFGSYPMYSLSYPEELSWLRLYAVTDRGEIALRYYHEDRTHLGLGKGTPEHRVAASTPANGHKVVSFPRLGGLHHRYTVAA